MVLRERKQLCLPHYKFTNILLFLHGFLFPQPGGCGFTVSDPNHFVLFYCRIKYMTLFPNLLIPVMINTVGQKVNCFLQAGISSEHILGHLC